MGRLARKLREAGKLPSKKDKGGAAPPQAVAAKPAPTPPTQATPKRETTSIRRRTPERPPEGNLGISQLTELIQMYPDYTDAYVQRGALLYKTGRLENAVYDFNMALRLDATNAKALYWRGCVYAHYNKFREAAADFRKAIPGDKGADVCYMCAFALERTGDLDGALAMLDKALSRNAAHVKSYALRGEIRVRRRQYDEALEDLTKAIEAEPDNASAIASRAQISIAKGNFGRALEDLNAALRIDPKLAQAYHDRGVIVLKKRDWNAAIAELERAVSVDASQTIDPRYADAYLARGLDRHREGRFEAIADFETVERMNPDVLPKTEFSEALRRRATAELDANKLDAAVRDFERADQLVASSPVLSAHVDARYQRGVARARRGEHDGALEDLEWTVRQRGNDLTVDPGFGASYGHRGVRRSKAGEHADAIADLTRGIALAPTETLYREERGKCYFALGDYDRAAGDFELLRRVNPAAELAPEFFAAFGHRAKARLAKGDFLGAVADFEVAVAVDPEAKSDPAYAGAYLSRCQHLLAEKKYEAALADWERAAAAKPDVLIPPALHVAYCTRAQSRHARGKTDHAMNDLVRAMKVAPQDAEAYALRGRIHMDRMDFADALKDLEKALSLDASRKDALAPLVEEARQAMR